MHVHAKKPNNSHHNLLWIALFSPMIMFFILFNSRLGYFLFSLVLFVVIFFTSYLYWNFLLFPNKTGKQRIAQPINNVFNLIQHPYLINVANGRLDTDYFLLQEKPFFWDCQTRFCSQTIFARLFFSFPRERECHPANLKKKVFYFVSQ